MPDHIHEPSPTVRFMLLQALGDEWEIEGEYLREKEE